MIITKEQEKEAMTHPICDFHFLYILIIENSTHKKREQKLFQLKKKNQKS